MKHTLQAILKLFFAVIFFVLPLTGWSQVTIAQWTFEGNTTAAASTHPNVTATNAAFSGVNSVTFVAGNGSSTAYSAADWTNAAAINTNQYLEVSVSPASGYVFSLTELKFDERRSGTGVTQWIVRSSADNFASNLGSGAIPDNTNFRTQTVALSSIQNQAGEVRFRIYGFQAENATGSTWRFDNITISGTVALSGGGPTLAISPTTLTGFITAEGTPSPLQNYTISGSSLTGDVTVSAPTGYEIKRAANASYSSTLTLSPSGGALASTTINVRLTGAAQGSFSGNITHTSPGLSTQNISVSGTVNAASTPCGPSIAITAARSSAENTVVTITGRITAGGQFFNGQNFYVQDATGGLEVFDNPQNRGATFAIGDLVSLTGRKTTFAGDGEIQIDNITCIQKVDNTNAPVVPTVVTNAQLGNFLGQLVTLNGVSFSTSGTFAGSTNYTLSDGTIVRIVNTTDLVGSTIPAGAINITGIVGTFGGVPQLLPRFQADVPGAATPPTTACSGDGVTTGSDQTFEFVTWNLEWFGFDGGSYSCPTGTRAYTDNGPTNETLQAQNVQTVIQNLNADVFAFQEVSDPSRLEPVLSSLGYGMTCLTQYYSYYFQDQCDPAATFPSALAQKLCFGYKLSTVTPIETKALQLPATTSGGGAWASGRVPYMLVADVTINGQTRRLYMVDLHAKSGSSADDRNRRQADATTLKAELDAQYGNVNLIVGGDFNDDFDVSISGGTTPYDNFKSDNANYSIPTQAFNTSNCRTTVSFTDAIDHVMISNELTSAYINNSAVSIRPGILNYGNTTTDHYPTMVRFNLAGASLPVTLISFQAKLLGDRIALSWETATEKDAAYFEVERSANAREFAPIGRVTAAGNTNQQQSYSLLDTKPLTGTTYYRLRQVDKDGTFEKSKIIAVSNNPETPILEILGNPADGRQIRLLIRNVEPQTLTLTSVTGQPVPVRYQTNADQTMGLVPVQGIQPGLYFIRGQAGGVTLLKKVVVH